MRVHVEGQTPVLWNSETDATFPLNENQTRMRMRGREMSLTAIVVRFHQRFQSACVAEESIPRFRSLGIPKATLFQFYLLKNMCQRSSVSHLNSTVKRTVIKPKKTHKAKEQGSMEPILIPRQPKTPFTSETEDSFSLSLSPHLTQSLINIIFFLSAYFHRFSISSWSRMLLPQ